MIVSILLLCLAVVGISAMSNIGLPVGSSVTDHLAAVEKSRLAEAIHLRQELGDEVWPGWSSQDTPIIVYNEEYAFLVGYSDPPEGWIRMPQNEQRGGPWELVEGDDFEGQPYYRQPLPDPDITPENFTVLVGERWVATMQTKEYMEIAFYEGFRSDLPPVAQPFFPYRLAWGLLMGNTENYISGLEHESFHALQGSLVPDKLAEAEFTNRQDGGYPWDDSGLGTAWNQEAALLVQGVRAKFVEESTELARQFLAQRDLRRESAGLSQAQVDYERQREWLEGLAKYAELQLCLAASTSLDYLPVPGLAQDPVFKGYANMEVFFSGQIDEVSRSAGREGGSGFYYSGMAQAVMLDRLLPGWKERAFGPGIMLEDLLREALVESK